MRGRDRRGQQRYLVLVALVDEVLRRRQAIGQQNRRDAADQQLVHVVHAAAQVEARVIRQLFLAKHLDARRVDQVQVADQVGGRHAVIGNRAVRRALARDPVKRDFVGVVVDEFLHREHGSDSAWDQSWPVVSILCTMAGSGSVASASRNALLDMSWASSARMSRCCCVAVSGTSRHSSIDTG